MSDAGALILDRVRRSLADSGFARDSARPEHAPPAAGVDCRELAASFARELAAVGGVVHRPDRPEDAVAAVMELLREAGAGPLLAWDESELSLTGMFEALRSAGFSTQESDLPRDAPARRDRLKALGRPVVGLTGARAGLSDTGSLVLSSGKGRPRTASLLPETHIALLRVRDLYPTLASFLKAVPDAVFQSSNLVLITGPSRTADIELILTIGVHGPKTLHVVLVPDP